MADTFTHKPESFLRGSPQNAFQRIVFYKDLLAYLFFFSCILVLTHAGGHIVAGAVGLAGLVGLIGHRIPAPKYWSPAIWGCLAFVIYYAASNAWSGDSDPGPYSNLVKFAVGAPLSAMLILHMSRQFDRLRALWRVWLGYGLLLAIIVISVDILSGFKVTLAGDPDANPGNIEGNISHALSVFLVVIWPAIFMVWADKARWKRAGQFAIAALLLVLTIAVIVKFQNEASRIAMLSGGGAVILALWRPRFTLNLIFVVFSLLLISAPWLGFAASNFSDTQKAALPFSWEWRVETWSYLWDKILENPFIGHGFGSLRGFTETFSARGFDDLAIVPVHAHNAGLHLWTEGGGVGILITVIALMLIRKAVVNSRWMTPARAAALAGSLAAIIVYANLSYSVWQDWWIGTIALSAAMIPLIPTGVLTRAAKH
ncbi:O-antigen ligase family protein [Robiginitomaculum antarcticum]|uniref:O-antigen ligase family protein n=1 Tax=Robiginitomaculum antarcticum TaxID=437507 RepID=UPI0003613C8F|nr:O-antigen ligase family protein [Robiginitomaculum antarcticum]